MANIIIKNSTKILFSVLFVWGGISSNTWAAKFHAAQYYPASMCQVDNHDLLDNNYPNYYRLWYLNADRGDINVNCPLPIAHGADTVDSVTIKVTSEVNMDDCVLSNGRGVYAANSVTRNSPYDKTISWTTNRDAQAGLPYWTIECELSQGSGIHGYYIDQD